MLADALGVLAPVVPPAARAAGLARTLPGAPGVALTFDDGPHPEGTPAVLELLAGADIHATFFLVGEQVQRRPQLANEIVAAGHTVAIHAFRHRLQLRMTAAELEDDLAHARAVISDAAGVVPVWHRPPFGIYSASGLRAVRDAGLRSLLWSRWGRDWRRFTTPARIAARAAGKLTPGDVILLHDADFYSAKDSYRRTIAALPRIIALLERAGLGTVLPS